MQNSTKTPTKARHKEKAITKQKDPKIPNGQVENLKIIR